MKVILQLFPFIILSKLIVVHGAVGFAPLMPMAFVGSSSQSVQKNPRPKVSDAEGPYDRYTTAFTTASSTTTSLLAKKKKKAAPAAAKKVQVKLLQHVAGTGQAGEVVMVTSPFFNNKLRPTKLAVIISDEEVAQEQKEMSDKQSSMMESANAFKEKIESATLTVSRKAGPDGKLYGGIGPKILMDELKKSFTEDADFLDSKAVKVTGIVDADGKKIRGDIKQLGEFEASMSLAKSISCELKISIESI